MDEQCKAYIGGGDKQYRRCQRKATKIDGCCWQHHEKFTEFELYIRRTNVYQKVQQDFTKLTKRLNKFYIGTKKNQITINDLKTNPIIRHCSEELLLEKLGKNRELYVISDKELMKINHEIADIQEKLYYLSESSSDCMDETIVQMTFVHSWDDMMEFLIEYPDEYWKEIGINSFSETLEWQFREYMYDELPSLVWYNEDTIDFENMEMMKIIAKRQKLNTDIIKKFYEDAVKSYETNKDEYDKKKVASLESLLKVFSIEY